MSAAILHSTHVGELVAAQIRISPRLLEDLLEALASADFPINPEIRHASLGSRVGSTIVRFEVLDSQIPTLRDVLATSGFAPNLLEINRSLGGSGRSYDKAI